MLQNNGWINKMDSIKWNILSAVCLHKINIILTKCVENSVTLNVQMRGMLQK